MRPTGVVQRSPLCRGTGGRHSFRVRDGLRRFGLVLPDWTIYSHGDVLAGDVARRDGEAVEGFEKQTIQLCHSEHVAGQNDGSEESAERQMLSSHRPPATGVPIITEGRLPGWFCLVFGEAQARMSHHYRLYDSIHRVPQEAWLELQRPGGDLYMDPRFIAVVEATMSEAARFWHLLVYDDNERPVGSACLCLFPLDAALLCPPRPRRVLQAIRHVWRNCLLVQILFCGLPVSAGQSHIRFAAGADTREVLRQMDAAMVELAAGVKNAAIICKEFAEEELPQIDGLRELGYVRGPSLPMNVFPHRFGSFDEFCGALRSHYRYKVHRSQRKFAKAGFRIAHLRGAEAAEHYTDPVHQLYLDVADRAEVRLETLPAEFFRQLALRCGDAVHMTAIFQGERIVAFSWGWRSGGSYQNALVGFDYALNHEHDLYFNLMAQDLDYALRQGAQEILVGQTADVFKSRIGCEVRGRYVYVKGTRWFSARPLRVTYPLFMPPPVAPPVRDLFREVDSDVLTKQHL